MLKGTSNKLILLLISLSIITTIILISINQRRSVSDDLDCNLLTSPIKTLLTIGLTHKPEIFDYSWFIIKIDHEKIQYFVSQPKHLLTTKFVKALHEIEAMYPYKLPAGEFMIILEDGVERVLPWHVLSFASSKELVRQQKVILMPDYEALNGYDRTFKLINQGIRDYPWEKKQAKIFWRGTANGYDDLNVNIYQHPRLKFMKFISDNKHLDFVDAGFTSYAKWFSHHQPYSTQIIEVKEKFPLQPIVPMKSSLKNKYLLDVDGNSCSYSRMAWILYSNSLLMKHTSNKVQWYYDRLQPYVHYLPINEDFSNLPQQFRWAESHQTKVIAMTKNAHQLATELFNKKAIMLSTIEAFKRYNQRTDSIKERGFDAAAMQLEMIKKMNEWTPQASKQYLLASGLRGNKGIRPNITIQ